MDSGLYLALQTVVVLPTVQRKFFAQKRTSIWLYNDSNQDLTATYLTTDNALLFYAARQSTIV